VALILRMARGDQQAFGDFYDRYSGLAFNLIRRIVPRQPDAEEVLQTVFLQVWADAASYDQRRGSPEAWLVNLARSRAIDKLRSIRRRGETFVSALDADTGREPSPATPNPGEVAENRRLVQTALARLPEPQRRVIELAFFAGLTQSEIALRLGEPLGTIKTRMRLGLDRLRDHLRAAARPSQ